MKHQLSILIPTYNDSCTEIVRQLDIQARKIADLDYEILIGDDGSTDPHTIEENQLLTALPHCKVYRFEKNRGRAAIRNSLVEFAEKEWLLFVDSGDMRIPSNDFLRRYIHTTEDHLVVYGGYTLSLPSPDMQESNLRYKYEMAARNNSSASRRKKMRHPNFQSSNFMAHRDLCRQVPFDERFVRYGHEDTLWAKDVAKRGIEILHIDNPVERFVYDDNATYLRMTIEALTTLREFQNELSGYSRLITVARLIQRLHLSPIVRFLFRQNEHRWRTNLEGDAPSLTVFNLFRLGYFLS